MSISRLAKLGIPVFAAAIAIATPLVSHLEGKRQTAYLDAVGVATICYGHTATARIGQTLTADECNALLEQDLGDAFDAVDRNVTVDLPDTRRAALASWVYNLGEGALIRSTLLRQLNTGNTVAACNEMLRWVYAGGEKLAGLVRRREIERELCLIGVEQGSRLAAMPGSAS